MTTTSLLLATLDDAYDGRSWHGTNLRGSLRGITRDQAAWRAGKNRHNIWELMLHAAYWKYDVRRKLTGAKGRSFAMAGSNFWVRPLDGTLAEWRADLALLDREHAQLRDAVERFPERRWPLTSSRKPFTNEGLVRGIAAHDLYHAGQIQLLKRLQNP